MFIEKLISHPEIKKEMEGSKGSVKLLKFEPTVTTMRVRKFATFRIKFIIDRSELELDL